MPSPTGQPPASQVDAGDAGPKPSTFAIAGHPVHPMLIPFPIAFLVGALVTDLVFALTAAELFGRMSVWLLAAGIVTGVVAAVPGLVDWLTTRRARRLAAGKIHAWGNALILAIAVVNGGLRVFGDPLMAITPWGLILSAVVALGLAVTGWTGGELSYRHMIGVDPHADLVADGRSRRG